MSLNVVVSLLSSLLSLYQDWFPLVSQFQSKFQEVKQRCHSTGHACSDVISDSSHPCLQWPSAVAAATGLYGTSEHVPSLLCSLNVKKDLKQEITLINACRKTLKPNSGDKQDKRSLSTLPVEGFWYDCKLLQVQLQLDQRSWGVHSPHHLHLLPFQVWLVKTEWTALSWAALRKVDCLLVRINSRQE